MLRITTEPENGKNLITVGIVEGCVYRTDRIVRGRSSETKKLNREELTRHREMMKKAREEATRQMVEDAEKLGADAIRCVRYSTASVEDGSIEVKAYGTAVKYR